ncbi:MAG: hypothetical protein M3Q23_02875 [Actinomycetota bacterium]|nr:hypothetical protein [Actinomycetota bacterium]
MKRIRLLAPFLLLALLPLALAGCGARAEAGPPNVLVQHVTIHWSRFHPANFVYAAGTTVRFVVHNTDPIDHEFILGSRAVQDYVERTSHPDHDGSVPGQVSVPAGATVETTYTFGQPGTVLLGCHIFGHYAYGMRGSVRVS